MLLSIDKHTFIKVTDVEEVGNAYKLDPKGNAPPITTRITVDIGIQEQYFFFKMLCMFF